jgi:16S rRNA U1498 N3-methylase RsmE
MINEKAHYLVTNEKNTIPEKHMRLKGTTQECRKHYSSLERLKINKKVKLIDFSKKSRLKELKEFFTSSVSLSLLSLKATQQTLTTVRLHLFQSLERQRICIQLEKMLSLFHTLIHSHLSLNFTMKMSMIQRI